MRILRKLLFIVVLLWFLFIAVIVRKIKFGAEMLLDTDFVDTKIFNELRNNKISYEFGRSRFKVWKMLPLIEKNMKIEDKYSAISGRDFPPGAGGLPVVLKDKLKIHIKNQIRKGWEEHSFNQFVSDLIPLNRSLPDPRDSWCKEKVYKNLPRASVIICFYNEAWSTLLRTINSVLIQTPETILNEIILVDDFSTMEHLKSPLEKYIKSMPKVKLIRAFHREGLAKARIIGTKSAMSSIVVFLDSHCECTKGWLEPLLERVSEDTTRVVSPIIDVIHPFTFEYISQDSHEILIGGFTCGLKFTWISIPHDLYTMIEDEVSPLRTPTISGGLFAINKQFFKKLGYYDEGFNLWGADNLELSFKTWMCGGSLEIIPCSHVGHIFRDKFPYEVPQSVIRMNHIRLAEVWLDDYAKYFYERIGNNIDKVGDVSKMRELRHNLQCKNFSWYLKNVYPQFKIPDMHVASGQIISLIYDGFCLDSSTHKNQNIKTGVNLVVCHGRGGNQFWVYTKNGEIRRDGMCLDYMYHSVLVYLCRGNAGSQIWLYDNKTKHIKNKKTQKCLTATHRDGYKVILQNCLKAYSQMWMLDNLKTERLQIKQ